MVERVAVIGAGIGGLCTALALAPTGREITLYERDPPPPEGGPEEAFDHWGRRGVGHLRHSHGFLARLRGLFAKEHPQLLAELAAAGVREISFADSLPEPLRAGYSPRPGDEELAAFVARRTTVELVMRAHVERQPNVTLRSGVFVRTPIIERSGEHLVARGLVIEEDGQEREALADLVVDSGGRSSIAIDALVQAGAEVVEEGEDCAILYYTRFYRFRDGQDEPPRGPHGGTGDLGYLKFGVFRADNRTFSVTIAVPEVEQTLRMAVIHPEVFESICAVLPGVAPWTDPARSEPITKVLGMGDLMSRWREYAPGGKPAVLGLIPMGDALVRTNPLYGRGCSFAAVEAHILRDVLEETADPGERLVRYSAKVKAALKPFYDDMAAQDRAAAARALRGLDPNRRATWAQKLGASFARDGLAVAVRSDPDLLRQALRAFHMLDPPMKLQAQPMTLVKGLAAWSRGRAANAAYQTPKLGPDRAEMFARLSLPPTADFERVRSLAA
jgi:2-polyprenyl-6-methoxyphenol hydroxylase-like FAD-dependent oxidoreductase